MRSPITELPNDLLSRVLGYSCDGKSLSTFYIVARTNAFMRPISFGLIRDACVLRYGNLIEDKASDEPEEVQEILLVMKETIRTFDTAANVERCVFDHAVPRWAAILDYFETQLSTVDTNGRRHWVLWCGSVGTEYGIIHAYLTSPSWDVGLLERFHEDELTGFELVQPRPSHVHTIFRPKGTLAPLSFRDAKRAERLVTSLEPHQLEFFDSLKYLTLPNMMYDASPGFCAESHLQAGIRGLVTHEAFPGSIGFNDHKPSWLKVEESLCCRFEVDGEGYDWEMALARLGDNVIRIMSKFVSRKASKTFGDAWRDVTAHDGNYNESDLERSAWSSLWQTVAVDR